MDGLTIDTDKMYSGKGVGQREEFDFGQVPYKGRIKPMAAGRFA